MASSSNGVVYTKEWVVRLILDLSDYVEDKPLYLLRACEPSCGEGAFLLEMVRRLVTSALDNNMAEVNVLKQCITACDTEQTSIEIAHKKTIDLLTEEFGFPIADAQELASAWIQQRDYLLECNSQFDLVIGNPPYVRSTDIDPVARENYCNKYSTMTRGCDIFISFFQHGLESLSENGILAFICADRWLQNQYGKKLREFISDNGYFVNTLIRMHGVDAFESEVDAYPAITIISRRESDIKYVDCDTSFSSKDALDLREHLRNEIVQPHNPTFSTSQIPRISDSSIIPLASASRLNLVLELIDKYPTLEDSGVEIGIGIATGNDKIFLTDNPDIIESERLLPAFNMRDVRRKTGKERWLVNPWNRDNTLVNLEDYPRTKAYLESHRDVLSKRHTARNGDWYRTIDKPKWDLLNRPMLLFPDMAAKPDPVYSDGSKYPCHNCYWLISNIWNLEALGGLLMSEIAEIFIDAFGVKMRGKTLRFQSQYLRLIHVPLPDTIEEDVLEGLVQAFRESNREMASKYALMAYRTDSR